MDFIPQITAVFESIPRELVLVFKTNDLLRGLDARLQTSAASASFISMSKCCLRALFEDEYSKSHGFLPKCKLYGRFRWNQFRLFVYQLSLAEHYTVTSLMKGVVGLATRHLTDTMKWMNDISYWFLAKLLFR